MSAVREENSLGRERRTQKALEGDLIKTLFRVVVLTHRHTNRKPRCALLT